MQWPDGGPVVEDIVERRNVRSVDGLCRYLLSGAMIAPAHNIAPGDTLNIIVAKKLNQRIEP